MWWRSKDTTSCHTRPKLATGRTIYVSGNMFAWITRAMGRLLRPQWFIQNPCLSLSLSLCVSVCLSVCQLFQCILLSSDTGKQREHMWQLHNLFTNFQQTYDSEDIFCILSFVFLFAYVLMIYLTVLKINYLRNKEGDTVFFCSWQPYLSWKWRLWAWNKL
jgi:hypothetical protein